MLAHFLGRDGKPQLVAQAADAGHGAVGILERLTEQGLGCSGLLLIRAYRDAALEAIAI